MHIERRLPLKNRIVFESNLDFADNTFEVYQNMLKMELNEQYKMFWFLNGKSGHNLPSNVYEVQRKNPTAIDRIKVIIINSRARYIIDCNSYVKKFRKDQVRIHIKHGLPIKDASSYNHKIGEVDALVVPFEKWVAICSEEHKLPKKLIKPLGFPRNDILIPKVHEKKLSFGCQHIAIWQHIMIKIWMSMIHWSSDCLALNHMMI